MKAVTDTSDDDDDDDDDNGYTLSPLYEACDGHAGPREELQAQASGALRKPRS